MLMFEKLKSLLGFAPINPLRTVRNVWTCHIYFNDEDILIVCVHGTPHGLSPVGFPMEKLPRNTPPEIVGKITIDCLNESKLTEHEIDSLKTLDHRVYSLPGFKQFYKLAGVRSERALMQKYRLIFVSRGIDDEEIELRVMRTEKSAYLFETGYPSYCVPPIASEVGEKIRLGMEYQPPEPKQRKKRSTEP